MNMKKFIRPAMLVVPLAAGWCVPQAGVLGTEPYNFIRWALIVMLFLNVLQINISDLKPRLEHFWLVAVNIFVGVIPYLLFKYFCPSVQEFADGAFFAGIAPTAVSSAVVVSLLNGNVGFAVTGFIFSNVGICLALLGLLPWVTGNLNMKFFFTVLYTLSVVILCPLVCAQLTRRIFPGILKYSAKLKEVTLILWSLTLFVIAAVARKSFDANVEASGWMIWVLFGIAFVICALNFSLGYWLSRRKYRWESSQMLGQKNTTFAMFLVMEYAPGIASLATIFYVLFHNLWNSIQLMCSSARKK